MKYLCQICSTYSVIIEVFIILHFRMNKILLNEPLTKWLTSQEKAQCISWFIETKSDLQTQGIFCWIPCNGVNTLTISRSLFLVTIVVVYDIERYRMI